MCIVFPNCSQKDPLSTAIFHTNLMLYAVLLWWPNAPRIIRPGPSPLRKLHTQIEMLFSHHLNLHC